MNTTGNPKYDELVAQSATRNGIDPNLMVAVMRQESGFNPRARSYKGATGLMQLMPATAARFGVTNIYDVAQNIEGGAKYLRFLLDTFNGDIELTLAGYNAGEHAVMNSGYRVPRYRETQNYVKSISARYDRAKNGGSRSARIAAVAVAPSSETFSNGRLSNNY
jgi:soluble lytic murein transglycosylase-like protein